MGFTSFKKQSGLRIKALQVTSTAMKTPSWNSAPARRLCQRNAWLAWAVALVLAGCTPQIELRGHVIEEDTLKTVKEGVDNKDSIAESLGTPSTIATFDADVWYYISTTQRREAFFDPELMERTIVAVEFDPKGNVAGTRRYTLKDGRVVAWVSRETPTRGRELTFLEQMFGNFGRFSNTPASGSGGPGGGRGGGR